MSDPPKWFYSFMFFNAVCQCSRRTTEEESKFGSYCQTCWDILKHPDKQLCQQCQQTKIQKERLYLTTDKLVLCKRCFEKGGW